MIIEKPGKYELLKDWSSRGSRSQANFKAGAVMEITQVDPKHRHVIGPLFMDWAYWDMPVRPLT